jgi:flagellar biosynthesis protein FlhF
MAVAFGTIGAEFLVATRLDVSRRIGCILSAAYTGLALAEAGVGDGAADGLVPMTSDLLARRLLEVPKP